MHLIVLRTQQMLPMKMSCPPGLSRANQGTALPATASNHEGPHFHAFSARSYHSMHLSPSLVHLLTLSSNFNYMSSFCSLLENSCKEPRFHLQR